MSYIFDCNFAHFRIVKIVPAALTIFPKRSSKTKRNVLLFTSPEGSYIQLVSIQMKIQIVEPKNLSGFGVLFIIRSNEQHVFI